MRRSLRSAFAVAAILAMAACGGGDDVDVDAELAPPPVDTTPLAPDTMMADTMMTDTMVDTLTTTTGQ